MRLTHRLTALACPEAKKSRSLAGLFLCFYPISSAHGQSIAKPVVVCRGHDAYARLAQGAVFIGGYPKEICFAQQLSANRCYLASPGPFGSKAREVIRLFPGLFLYRNQEDAAVRKKFVRAWKAQSEHAYKSLFIFRQKKLCLAAPSRGFFMFLSRIIRPRPKLAPSSASFAGMTAPPPPRGFFLTANSGKGEYFYAIRFCENQTRICKVVRCAAGGAFLTECSNLCPRFWPVGKIFCR